MSIAPATDHAGFEDLRRMQIFLESLGHECRNYGPTALDMDDDYPDYIFPAAYAVANGECERGIIYGGSGQGEAMAANRVEGVRCAVFYGPVVAKQAIDADGQSSEDPFAIVRLSREHNNANMLSLAARFLGWDEMREAVEIWLGTPGPAVDRHLRRIKKLDAGLPTTRGPGSGTA